MLGGWVGVVDDVVVVRVLFFKKIRKSTTPDAGIGTVRHCGIDPPPRPKTNKTRSRTPKNKTR